MLMSQRIVGYNDWKSYSVFVFVNEMIEKTPLVKLHNLFSKRKKKIIKQICTLMWAKGIETGNHGLSQSQHLILRVGPLLAEQN